MIYIMSDTHGQYERYQAMMEKIDLKKEDTLYVLGDVIDRGLGSMEILLDIMERENVVMFLGNHEHMMLTYLQGKDRLSWFFGVNGGRITYHAFKSLDKETRNKILDYLYEKTLIKKDLYLNDKRFILSHTGGIIDGVDLYTKDYKKKLMDIQEIVWNMGPYDTFSIKNFEYQEKKTYFISGHIITRRLQEEDSVFIEEYENNCTWIDIDCGCAMGKDFGYLSCLCIDEDGEIKDIYYVR